MNNAGLTSVNAWSIPDYGSVEDLKLATLPMPSPKAGQLLVKVEAVSINPLDLKLIGGVMREFMPVRFPFVPGTDICGRVAVLGPGVTAYKLNDRVVGMSVGNGGLASYALCGVGPATALAPDALPAIDLAALPEAGLAALAVLREANLTAGSTVAIIGATGGIGLYLCQLASKAGAHVIATAAPDDEALVRSNGARETIDYASVDTIDELKRRYHDGVAVVIDLIHQFDDLLHTARAVASGGRLISTLLGPDPGVFPSTVNVHYVRLSPQTGDLDSLVTDLKHGAISPNVSVTVPFADAPRAYKIMREGHVRGKIVVVADA